jgi:hypothetical protein
MAFQKTFKEKSFVSEIDKLNVYYKRDFLTPQKADKYYEILDNLLKEKDKDNKKRTSMGFGNKDVCKIYPDISSWDDNNDIVCQILRVMHHHVEKLTGLKFNFVLINRYPSGDSGIGRHRDKEDSLGETPTIAGVSLGGMRDIQFEASYFIPKEMPKNVRFVLDHGSIYVMYHPTNRSWTHEIPKMPKVTKSRISLTFRHLYDVE